MPDHGSGTDHQDISGIEKLVFIGDSVTAGTPPTEEHDFYRSELTRDLEELWGMELEVAACPCASPTGSRTSAP